MHSAIQRSRTAPKRKIRSLSHKLSALHKPLDVSDPASSRVVPQTRPRHNHNVVGKYFQACPAILSGYVRYLPCALYPHLARKGVHRSVVGLIEACGFLHMEERNHPTAVPVKCTANIIWREFYMREFFVSSRDLVNLARSAFSHPTNLSWCQEILNDG